MKLGIIVKTKNFLQQCRRVLMVATKPDKEEFKISTKIVSLGMVVLGIIAFIIFMIFQFIPWI
jgi:protein transport protein SEC61 subunit gamma-like protein